MPDEHEQRKTIEELLTFWQKQCSESLRDPEIIARQMGFMQQWQQACQAAATVNTKDQHATEPTTATHPPAVSMAEYIQLCGRLAALESRVAQLEAEQREPSTSGATSLS